MQIESFAYTAIGLTHREVASQEAILLGLAERSDGNFVVVTRHVVDELDAAKL